MTIGRPAPAPPRSGGGLARWLRGLSGREALTLILIAAVVWSVVQVDWADGVLRSNGWETLGDLVAGFARPDLSGVVLERAFEAAWITVVYAVAGLSLAIALAIPLSLLASGVVVSPTGRRRRGVRRARALLAALRSVHELVWAWLFVAAIGLSPFAAIFALAIPYAGILGRIYADFLEEVPEPPLRALRGAGAGPGAMLLYGRVPFVLADLASYTFYRFECGLRASSIMGFVGLGGLGLEIQLALADLDYRAASTYLIVLIALIALVEWWSDRLRRRLNG